MHSTNEQAINFLKPPFKSTLREYLILRRFWLLCFCEAHWLQHSAMVAQHPISVFVLHAAAATTYKKICIHNTYNLKIELYLWVFIFF